MSSRIIRGDERSRKQQVRTSGGDFGYLGLTPRENVAGLEQVAYENGFREGERAGRQAAERNVEAAVQRYDGAVVEMAVAQRSVAEMMETQTVLLAIEIARKIIQREVSVDPDLVGALATVAIRRVQSHQMITVRVSRHDFERVREAIAEVNPAIVIMEESAMERGDFTIDTAQTHLDGRLQNQVEMLGRVMLEES